MKKPLYFEGWDYETKKVYKHDVEEIWDKNISPCIYYAYQKRLKIIISKIINLIAKNSLILDIGSAQATIPLILAEIGYKILANDIRTNFLIYAKMKYEKGDIFFLAGNYEEINFKINFDLITAFEVIEHLPNPYYFLRKVHNDLKKNGYLILTTPNGLFIRNKLPSYYDIKGKKICKDFIYSADGDKHFFAFRLSELIKILSHNGFKIEGVGFINSFLILGHIKTKILNKFLSPKFINFIDDLIISSSILKEKLSENILIICKKI